MAKKPKKFKGSLASEKDAGYEVGYGKPPAQTQFKPGTSGNPQGRPKRPKRVEDLIGSLLKRKMFVTIGGVRKRITSIEALVEKLFILALQGDRKALDRVLEFQTAHEACLLSRESAQTRQRVNMQNLTQDQRSLLRSLLVEPMAVPKANNDHSEN